MLPHGKLKKRRRSRSCRRKPPSAAEIFFLPFLAELDNSESFETNFFFWKNFRLVFAFDTCNFSKKKKKKFAIFRQIKNKLLLNDLGMSNSAKNSNFLS